jgi:hypothetical protein
MGQTHFSGPISSENGFKVGPRLNPVPVPERVLINYHLVAAATAANWVALAFIADAAYQVVSVKERHATKGTDSGAVTMMAVKVPSGTAKASGTDLLSAGINLKGDNDTNQSGTLHGTAANTKIAAGDAIGFTPTGTLTALANVTVTVELRRI